MDFGVGERAPPDRDIRGAKNLLGPKQPLGKGFLPSWMSQKPPPFLKSPGGVPRIGSPPGPSV